MHFQNSSNRIILFDTLQPEHVSVNIFILKCFYFCSGQIYLTPFSFRKNLVFWLESCLYMSVTHHGNQWDVDSCKHHYIYQVRQNVITTSVSVYFPFFSLMSLSVRSLFSRDATLFPTCVIFSVSYCLVFLSCIFLFFCSLCFHLICTLLLFCTLLKPFLLLLCLLSFWLFFFFLDSFVVVSFSSV